jgi:superfamily II DNA or RNA helicase
VQGKGGFNMTAPICVATIQSVRKGVALYPKKFYESFGFWIFDEVHIMGAATFSEAFKYCYGAFRLGLTATDERRDGSDKVYKWFLGQPRVKAEGKSMHLKAFVHNYSNGGRYPFGNNLSVHISRVSQDQNRNKFITSLVLEAYNNGRNILVLGDRIPQLEEIKERLVNLGVKEADVGLYTGSATQANGKRKILKEKDIKYILKNCRVILSTSKKAEKGLNVPRLDWGMDITPKGKGVQATGRIRRLMKGKPLPEWHTIRDQEYPAFCGMCNSRVWEYKKKGFDVEFIG